MQFNSNHFCITVFCGIVFIFVNCSDKPVAEYSLDSILDKAKADSSDTVVLINVCTIIETDWDSLLVIKPYASVSKQSALQNLDNYSIIKPKIEDIRYSDSFSYLVFVKDNKAIGFSRVNNVPIDFGSLSSINDSNPDVAVLDKTECVKIFKKVN